MSAFGPGRSRQSTIITGNEWESGDSLKEPWVLGLYKAKMEGKKAEMADVCSSI